MQSTRKELASLLCEAPMVSNTRWSSGQASSPRFEETQKKETRVKKHKVKKTFLGSVWHDCKRHPQLAEGFPIISRQLHTDLSRRRRHRRVLVHGAGSVHSRTRTRTRRGAQRITTARAQDTRAGLPLRSMADPQVYAETHTRTKPGAGLLPMRAL